jgi:diguanylate cyclase (GGDEF)-like protein/PAS domain S-box-containing protein
MSSNTRLKVFKGYRAIVLWLLIFLFSLFSLLLSILAELNTTNKAFHDRSAEIHRTLKHRITNLETVLTSLVGFHHASDYFDIAKLASFSNELLKAYPFISSIMHATRISEEDIGGFEQGMREQGFVGFRLKVNHQQNQVQFGQAHYYLPVSFIDPMDPLSASVLGYDLMRHSGTIKRVQQSVKQGKITTFGPVEVSRSAKSQYLVVKPVYLGRYPPGEPLERLDMFNGMAVLSIGLGQLVDGLIGPDRHYDISLKPIADKVEVKRRGIIAGLSPSKIAMNLTSFDHRQKVEIYGANFELSINRSINSDIIDWQRVIVIWMLSLLVLVLAIGVYRNKRLAQLQKNEANAAIAAGDARFSHVIDTAFDAVITADASCVILNWNHQAAEVFGYTEQDVLGLHLFQLILTHKSLTKVSEVLESIINKAISHPTGIRLEVEGKDKHSREFPLDLAISCSKISEIHSLSVFARDITDLKRRDEKIRTLAYHDSLTKLPNRQAFKEQVTRAIKIAKRYQRLGAVLFLDLDGFKRINDTLGHDIGDMLLKQVTHRLETQVRETDIVGRDCEDEGINRNVSRLGGDEFTILLEDIQKPEAAAVVAKRVQDAIGDPYNLKGHEVYVTPSIGIAIIPKDGQDVETLLKSADTAMYHAKTMGKNNFQFYSEQMNVAAAMRLKLEGKLRKALTNSEMELYYQPQINLNTGQIVSVEALLRWNDSELGAISPIEFIPIAEETGMIIELGEWVLNEACRQNKQWQDVGFPPIRVAINLSNLQLIQRDLTTKVAEILNHTKLDSKYLELEITESVIMHNIKETIATLNKFKEMGITISVDDFGTGYSSLNYLKRLPLDNLKIDRSFVKDIPENEDDITITSAIVGLAQSLGLGVIAEGVETESQLQFLMQLGCETVQGYLFSKPLNTEKLARMLRLHRDSPHISHPIVARRYKEG